MTSDCFVSHRWGSLGDADGEVTPAKKKNKKWKQEAAAEDDDDAFKTPAPTKRSGASLRVSVLYVTHCSRSLHSTSGCCLKQVGLVALVYGFINGHIMCFSLHCKCICRCCRASSAQAAAAARSACAGLTRAWTTMLASWSAAPHESRCGQ